MKRTGLLLASFCALAPLAAGQWSTPTLLPSLNSSGIDVDPVPTSDGLTLYLASNRTGNFEIFRATRAAPYGAFGTPTPVTEINSTVADQGPCTRVDDLEIFFFSMRPVSAGSFDLWRADRPSTSVPFNPPVNVTELNSANDDWGASLTLDGLRIYFTSNRPGGAGGYDIYTATRPSWGAAFSPPVPVVELNTSVRDIEPHISPDGLTIFFGGDRPGGLGVDDLWMATRLDPSSPFGNIVNLTALNTSAFDGSAAFALFHDELFMTSSRPGGVGSYEIYSARFTGLLGLGTAGPGSSRSLRFSDPSSAGLLYVAAASRGSSPGIPIGTRVLPLNFDLLLQLTIGGLPPILTGYVGALDRDGIASGQISFTGFPEFRGLRFFNAFVVLDPAAPLGIKTISNAHEVLVQ